MKRKFGLALVAGVMTVTMTFASSCSILEGFLQPQNSSIAPISTITLTEYAEPLDIHTELQNAYLRAGQPSELTSDVKGRAEYSIPQSIKLTWSDTQNCNNYTVKISETADFANAKTIVSAQKSVEIYNLKIATTYYWKVTQNMKDGTTSEVGTFDTTTHGPRNLFVEGVTNVRDVGGWVANGERTVQGLLYRGGRLNNSYPTGWVKGGDDTGYAFQAEITSAGAKVFKEELGIKTEIDFRTLDRNGYPGIGANETLFSAVDGVNYISIPMNGDADVNSNRAAIKHFFEVIADKSNYPVFYHCNIGTDRTGMVTYLINALCGVGDSDLYFDYMFSNFGLIALPSPQVPNPSRKELNDLTTDTGTAARVNAYAGSTLQEKARACLLSCGISEETLNTVYDIMTKGL